MTAITYKQLREDASIRTYIIRADESLLALGFTEHSFAHVTMVSENAAHILETLGYSEHEVELVRIAGYLHDIGNLINRVDHSQSGALLAFRLLEERGMSAEDISLIVTAIGNHDEGTGVPVNAVAAALILADKCDVRRSRVRNRNISTFDIHDRVNYSVTESNIRIDDSKATLSLNLTIDTQYCSIMDYFEIFMTRMKLCMRAANRLGLSLQGARSPLKRASTPSRRAVRYLSAAVIPHCWFAQPLQSRHARVRIFFPSAATMKKKCMPQAKFPAVL